MVFLYNVYDDERNDPERKVQGMNCLNTKPQRTVMRVAFSLCAFIFVFCSCFAGSAFASGELDGSILEGKWEPDPTAPEMSIQLIEMLHLETFTFQPDGQVVIERSGEIVTTAPYRLEGDFVIIDSDKINMFMLHRGGNSLALYDDLLGTEFPYRQVYALAGSEQTGSLYGVWTVPENNLLTADRIIFREDGTVTAIQASSPDHILTVTLTFELDGEKVCISAGDMRIELGTMIDGEFVDGALKGAQKVSTEAEWKTWFDRGREEADTVGAGMLIGEWELTPWLYEADGNKVSFIPEQICFNSDMTGTYTHDYSTDAFSYEIKDTLILINVYDAGMEATTWMKMYLMDGSLYHLAEEREYEEGKEQKILLGEKVGDPGAGVTEAEPPAAEEPDPESQWKQQAINISLPEHPTIGSNAYITWDSVENAESYEVSICNADSDLLNGGETTGTNYSVSSDLRVPGSALNIRVSAKHEGYPDLESSAVWTIDPYEITISDQIAEGEPLKIHITGYDTPSKYHYEITDVTNPMSPKYVYDNGTTDINEISSLRIEGLAAGKTYSIHLVVKEIDSGDYFDAILPFTVTE